MKRAISLCWVVGVLAVSACSSGGSGPGGGMLDGINNAPPDTGPGCYDHKNRKERTIVTEAECKKQDWVWRTQ